MQLVKIVATPTSLVDHAKRILKIYMMLSNMDIWLSDTQLTVMSYFMVYGYNKNTRKTVLLHKLLKTNNSLYNTVHKLKSCGLLQSDAEGDTVVNPGLPKPEPVMAMMIKMDNRK
jgi:hypothetical protein